MTNVKITKHETEAAKRAAVAGAEEWVRVFGRPFDGGDDEMFDTAMDEVARELGLAEGVYPDMPRLWPVYRAALVLRVYELLAEKE
jgi:hypothetical protein